jgi:hypothetical protein
MPSGILWEREFMHDSASHDIIRFGLASLMKLIIFFFVVLIISSIFLVTVGWILTMAFSEFKLFEATLIPLLILGFASVLIGLISIWLRLGEIGYVLDSESEVFDESDLYDEDYHFDEDDEDYEDDDDDDDDDDDSDNEISNKKNSANLAKFLKKHRQPINRQNKAPEASDDY